MHQCMLLGSGTAESEEKMHVCKKGYYLEKEVQLQQTPQLHSREQGCQPY